MKAEIPRISGYPHPVTFRTSGPSRNTHPPYVGEQPLRTPLLIPGDLLYFCFPATVLPPSHPLFLLSWTPMETVASWHGEVNYKRYQSLGVVGWLVGLGSTDSQLPLRADPRARAIPSSPAVFLRLYHLVQLFLSLSQHSASFPPSILRPHLTSVTNQDGLTP